eukprot:TRINITY_DN698_c0_g2_i1.p1 TRINITY_DN698_c0_g2~~TRINITY_DN698_c0_g2_i1.p1  ORF type:complete len:409 (+),score=80.77 TRINITY_DN698_c0_g2_i1:802-2028(+)
MKYCTTSSAAHSVGSKGDFMLHRNTFIFFANILGVITKLKINYADIKSIEKRKTALLFPNAIIIRAKQSQFFFYSFIHRDRAYELIRMKKCTYSRKKKENTETEEGTEETLEQEEVESEGIVNIDDGDVLDMIGDNDKEFLSINRVEEEEDDIADQGDPSSVVSINEDADTTAVGTSAPAVSWYDVVGSNQKDSLPALEPLVVATDSKEEVECDRTPSSSEKGSAITAKGESLVSTKKLALATEAETNKTKDTLSDDSKEIVHGSNNHRNALTLYISLYVSFLLVTSLIPGLSTSGGWRGYCAFLIILCTFVFLLHAPTYKWLQSFGLSLVHALNSGGVDQHMEFVGSTVIPIVLQPVLYALFLMTSAFLVSDFEIDSIVSLLLFSVMGSCVGLFFNQQTEQEEVAIK